MRRLLVLASLALAPLAAVAACSNSVGSVGIDADDASADSSRPSTKDGALDDATSPDAEEPDASGADANCPKTKTVPATGQTCTGFGTGSPCDTSCGLPAYGYVCFDGGPPNFTGCVQASASSFGETYCCAKNDCVAEPDQDSNCSGVSGKPHLYQCPPNGVDGGSVAIPTGCAAATVGGSPYAYACCP